MKRLWQLALTDRLLVRAVPYGVAVAVLSYLLVRRNVMNAAVAGVGWFVLTVIIRVVITSLRNSRNP